MGKGLLYINKLLPLRVTVLRDHCQFASSRTSCICIYVKLESNRDAGAGQDHSRRALSQVWFSPIEFSLRFEHFRSCERIAFSCFCSRIGKLLLNGSCSDRIFFDVSQTYQSGSMNESIIPFTTGRAIFSNTNNTTLINVT